MLALINILAICLLRPFWSVYELMVPFMVFVNISYLLIERVAHKLVKN